MSIIPTQSMPRIQSQGDTNTTADALAFSTPTKAKRNSAGGNVNRKDRIYGPDDLSTIFDRFVPFTQQILKTQYSAIPAPGIQISRSSSNRNSVILQRGMDPDVSYDINLKNGMIVCHRNGSPSLPFEDADAAVQDNCLSAMMAATGP
jgi:hypothetical protein